MSRHRVVALLLASLVLAGSRRALAQDDEVAAPPKPAPATPPAPAAPEEGVPAELSRLVLDDARVPFLLPKKGFFRLDAHGELQLRYQNLSNLALQPPVSDASLTKLGQRNYLTTWLRVGAQASVGDALKLTLQLDLAPQWIVGDLTQGVSAAGDAARDEHVKSFAKLRYAYADLTTPVGLVRLGQMGSHWGMGILANDGDHAMLFGDYRAGSIVERVAFATRPAGKKSPFVIVLAGDAVLEDNTAKWVDGDRAYQAVASAFYEKGSNFFGIYGVRRWQKVKTDYDEGNLRVWVLDATARGAAPLGADGAFIYGAAEIATIMGKTDAIRNLEFLEQDVRSYGGAASVGIMRQSKRDENGKTYGLYAFQVEGGYASGDANPNDGVVKRFTFDPNHQIGLVLFPYLMHFETARSATNAQDAGLTARPQPGVRFLPSKGGVFGAQYLNPTIVIRPKSVLDLKLGAVVAVASSDVVDPYRLAFTGNAANFRGGDSKSRDLGLELDLGFEWRVPMPPTGTLQIGGQAGFLFPGHAFDGPAGERAKTQSAVQGRLGVQF